MKAEIIRDLIYAHYVSDDSFIDIVKKIVEEETAANHGNIAWMLKDAVANGTDSRSNPQLFRLSDIANRSGVMTELIEKTDTRYDPSELVVSDRIHAELERIAAEYRKRDALKLNGLDADRKILIHGPSGTGKSMTAQVLARMVGLPFYVVRMESIIDSLMGKSSQNIANVFRSIRTNPGVYVLDEFDSISSGRGGGDGSSASHETRRIVNSVIQLIEKDESPSIIVCTTNMIGMIDFAVFRRFDVVIEYANPTQDESKKLITGIIGSRCQNPFSERILEICSNMSHANIKFACRASLKRSILENRDKIAEEELYNDLQKRKESVKNGVRKRNRR